MSWLIPEARSCLSVFFVCVFVWVGKRLLHRRTCDWASLRQLRVCRGDAGCGGAKQAQQRQPPHYGPIASWRQHFAEERERAGLTNKIGTRRSTALELFTLPDDTPTPFCIPALGADFKFYAVPVEHGAGYTALGFVFGRGVAFRSVGATGAIVANHSCVVYLSDVSTVSAAAMMFLQDLVKIDVLIVDLLHGTVGISIKLCFFYDVICRVT
ncbi:hypothetical protein BCY84_17337 [Trypanosoma cruzi cruzi]|nr:hypothetical protein BCY84_17337 [Trypanosoma cruzi cruzi]